MIDPAAYLVFLGTAFVVLIIPGPAVAYVIARSIDQGRRAGVVSALGLGVGNLFHVAAAVAGISALVASSAVAFSVVKYAGAAYLIYIGVRRLLERDEDEAIVSPRASRKLFLDGVVVNVLNPKVALFFLAFLPQFADTSAPVAPQLFVLGLTFALLGILTDGAYAVVVGTFGQMIRQSRAFRSLQRYVTGGVFLSLGVLSAATGQGRE